MVATGVVSVIKIDRRNIGQVSIELDFFWEFYMTTISDCMALMKSILEYENVMTLSTTTVPYPFYRPSHKS